MVTKIIDKLVYHQAVSGVGRCSVMMVDNFFVDDGYAIVPAEYEASNQPIFRVYYEREGFYYQSLCYLRLPHNSMYVQHAIDVAMGWEYIACPIGLYPENDETFQRFVAGKRILFITGELPPLEVDVVGLASHYYQSEILILYPGNIVALQKPEGSPGPKYVLPLYPDNDVYADLIVEIDRHAFRIFMIAGHSF
ncbi:hypothetical protein J2T02_002600 [Chitinophaga terrae (ex Kim and Jung 2007)]|uniref:hypothetical protein n=1 Tax=Chitinophaga terrae (ex Kim and Jung 2007) TaxID=408074 RepID=UPI002788A7B4|nr:hypothetical protein [Chitinophaga terrae (ex Kim and Jung 2007)]MDQ0107481.1 hypothetical protein [Chitinophaga terrae (ex Kim and Jung 2007)]